MDEYINDYLVAGIIHPSSSPVGAGFFVSKKDCSLHQCIDYCNLNNIAIKKRYPLPLLSCIFEPLQRQTSFIKLYLLNAYHFVKIWKGRVED